jgi:hypothetical protein
MEPEHVFLANQILTILTHCLITGQTVRALSLKLQAEEKVVHETLQALMRESHVVTRDVIIGQQPRTFYLASKQSQIVSEIIYQNVRGSRPALVERRTEAQAAVPPPEY